MYRRRDACGEKEVAAIAAKDRCGGRYFLVLFSQEDFQQTENGRVRQQAMGGARFRLAARYFEKAKHPTRKASGAQSLLGIPISPNP